MPLVKGAKAKTRKGFSENVEREMKEGHKPQKQAVAIAFSEARRSKKEEIIMAYEDILMKRVDEYGKNRRSNTDYNKDIDIAKKSCDSQLKDSDPMVEKEGFLGIDDVDKMRRRKVK